MTTSREPARGTEAPAGAGDPGNRVLEPGAPRSGNFFRSDRILRAELARRCTAAGLDWMAPRLDRLGLEGATRMDDLSRTADREGPRLESRDLYGERRERLVFHPAYDELKRIAVASGMFAVKWAPGARARFSREAHRLGFAAGQLYAMGEAGLYCPLCMTDGVARILDRHADPADRERLLPRVATADPEALATGAMFLTEKAGGSDVGANRCVAVPARPGEAPGPGDWARLHGEKWFCSNAGAEIVLALARSEAGLPGTRGLGLYLIEPALPDGRPNPRRYLRLKEKLGVRSMASAEIELDGVWGKRLGGPAEGFALMAEMINLSRLYNAVTAVALARRAIVEAYTHLSARRVFGRQALEHALVRERLAHLGQRWLAEFLLVWEAIEALDRADAGDATAARLVRLLTPMVKRSSAEFAVYATREAMELMGGLGYIEDGVLPKLHRDALVLPIWEGAGNIMLLDMLRALDKADAGPVLLEAWAGRWTAGERERATALLDALAGEHDRDRREALSRPALEELTALAATGLVAEAAGAGHGSWAAVALGLRREAPDGVPEVAAVEDLLGWDLRAGGGPSAEGPVPAAG
jgi:acyl-CoA dehydrogenase